MQSNVFIRGVENPDGLRAYAEEKFANALERFEERILDATMRIEDETGPEKGGVDKLCSVEVRLRHTEIHIKERSDDFHGTVNTVIDRLKTALSREVAKVKRGIGEG